MEKNEIEEVILRLVDEIDEEDVGISLFTTFYQNEDELSFFNTIHRERVLKILKTVSEDSLRHKEIIKTIIGELEKKL